MRVHVLNTTANVFEPEDIECVAEAFDDAWDVVSGDDRYLPDELNRCRTYLAVRILELALRGERDRQRLAEYGLSIFRH